jgi:hypothetical protein
VIRHLVCFNLKELATEEQLAAILRSARQQLTAIPGVRNLDIGKALDTHSQAPYRYALTMEFADEASLAVYIDHPLHQEFRKVFAQAREVVQSMDFSSL